jgi:hypothetical protein
MMEKDKNKEAWLRQAGIDNEIDDCVHNLKSTFNLSEKDIAKVLRDKASELSPRQQTKVIKVTNEMIKKAIEKYEKKG